MVKYALFLGCNIPFNYPDIEQSIRKSLPRLGIELEDMNGYTCCTAPAILPSLDENGWLAVSARNISIAERMGLNIVTGCNGCYSILNHARALLFDEGKRGKANELLGLINRDYEGKAEIYHVSHVLYKDVGVDKIKNSLKKRLVGFKIAIEYGCHVLWPSDIFRQDDPVRPKILHELCEALGAKVIDYRRSLRCCGGSGLRGSSPERSIELVKIKLDSIKEETDADMIITGCPSCFLQFDDGQAALKSAGKINYSIPVFHYTQVLALCMGFDPKEVTAIAVTPRDEIINRIVG
jgi:heterodisulfide reductase subunit B